MISEVFMDHSTYAEPPSRLVVVPLLAILRVRKGWKKCPISALPLRLFIFNLVPILVSLVA